MKAAGDGNSPIKTHRDYRRALTEIEELMPARRNTVEGGRLDVLVTLVEAWETEQYPIDQPGWSGTIAVGGNGDG